MLDHINLPRTGINVSVEHILITWQERINHAFLVLGRNPSSDITDVKSWGNALICDADPVSKFNIYSCKKIKDTYLEKINNKSVQVKVLYSSVRPKIHPFLIEKFNKKEMELLNRAIKIFNARAGEPTIREHKKPGIEIKNTF